MLRWSFYCGNPNIVVIPILW